MKPTAFFLLLFMAASLYGQTTFLNRPSKTQSAVVLETGILQLGSAYDFEISGGPDERETEALCPGLMLRYGLGYGVELRLANHYATRRDDQGSIAGFGDLELGTEIQLFKRSDRKTEVALMSQVFLPTGSAGISNERVGNETLVLVWHEITEELGIEYNLGYCHFEDDAEKGDIVYSFVAGYEISDASARLWSSADGAIPTVRITSKTGASPADASLWKAVAGWCESTRLVGIS